MPSVTFTDSTSPVNIFGGNDIARPAIIHRISYSGSLDKFTYNDVTPVIGREFEGLQIADLLKADDQVIKDLAVTSKSCPNI